MSSIGRNSIKSVIKLALLSRASILTIQIISNLILTDHNADAYRNKYHKAIVRLTTSQYTSQPKFHGEKHLPEWYWLLYRSIEGLTKWDSQYLLEISQDGYQTEQHLAFLPLYPLVVITIKNVIFPNEQTLSTFPFHMTVESSKLPSDEQLINYMITAIMGVFLNNLILFPIAAISLYGLTKSIKQGDEVYAINVVRWFCFNPASVFFSAFYTESLFSVLTFGAMFMIEYCSQSVDQAKTQQSQSFKALNELHKLIKICFPSLALISLSAATRSNGLVTIGFILYQFILKYIPLWFTNREGWSLTYYIFTFFEILQDSLFIILSILVSSSCYIMFQLYSYSIFCKPSDPYTNPKGMLKSILPDWCNSKIPHPYQYVQKKYWNVGPFNYYEWKQLPNFLLALPVILIILIGSQLKARSIARSRSPIDKRLFPYYIQAVMLVVFSSITINVQVVTRLIASSCPALYWIVADESKRKRINEKAIRSFFLGYFVLGAILYPNFYPWT